MAPPPIAGRLGEAVVWTGHEMLVWGGLPRTDTSASLEPATDGAAYDPATDTWRKLADPPPGTIGVPAGAVWTGSKVVLYGGNAPDGPAVAAEYDPATDSWRALPEGPLGPREGFLTVWTGKELIVLGGSQGDGTAAPIGAALNPETGKWRLLANVNKLYGLLPSSAFWTGRDVLITGTISHCETFGTYGRFHPNDPGCLNLSPFLGAFNPTTGTLTTLRAEASPQPSPGAVPYTSIGSGLNAAQAWTGTGLVFVEAIGDAFQTRVYTRATNAWRTAASPPCGPSQDAMYYSPGVPPLWTGSQFFFPCDATHTAVYTPSADAWRVVDTGQSPLSPRAGAAMAWTGSQVLMWSGTEMTTGNPTPNTGAIFTPSGA